MRALALIIALVATTASAQSNLPACQGSDFSRWSNCLGTRTWPNGDTYVGEYKDGKRNGQGTYTWPDSGRYVGEFRDNKLTGQGIFTATDGSPPQEGIWENNLFVRSQRILGHAAGGTPSTPTAVPAQSNLPACQGSDFSRWSNCLGTRTWPNGDTYVGEYKDGKRNGQGTYTWPDSGRYVGEFRDNKLTGQGIFTATDGSPPQEGIWENDLFVRSQRIQDHIAGRTFPTPATVANDASRGPSSSYGGLVAARIKPHVTLANPISGNPRAEVEVRSDTNGRIISRRLVSSSGNRLWDEAVLRAIDLTGTLPRDTDGRVPPALIIGLRPNDAKPDSVSSIQKSDHIAGRTSSMTRLEVLEASIDFEALIATKKGNLSACSGSNAARWSNCFGTSTFSNGDQYVGEFRGGKFNGQGSYTAANGNKYVGEFKDGKHSNQGILTFADGSPSKEGIWENGRFLRAQRIPDHIAGRSSPAAPVAVLATPPLAQAPRQAEPPRSNLALSLSTSQPNAEGVVTINITTNSDTASLKINGDEAGGRADGRYSVNRFAKIGSNSYEVIATDRFGNSSKQTVVVNREIQVVAERTRSLNPTLINAARPRDAVAIIIGIEKYKRVSDADFANNDASAFYDYARRALGIKPENIRLLVDDKADAGEILRAFKTWLPTRVNKKTTDVYVFYSGHGLPSEDGGSLYFLPHEVDRDLLERTAITQKEVVQAIQRTTPNSVTMFIDSCYSGQSRTGTSLLASARPISIAPKASTDFPSNFMVISASAPDQISSSSPELKHGIFSYYLMLGMEGEADVNKDGQITVGEMQTYLSQQVTRKASGMNRTQSPQTMGDLSRVLVQTSSKTR